MISVYGARTRPQAWPALAQAPVSCAACGQRDTPACSGRGAGCGGRQGGLRRLRKGHGSPSLQRRARACAPPRLPCPRRQARAGPGKKCRRRSGGWCSQPPPSRSPRPAAPPRRAPGAGPGPRRPRLSPRPAHAVNARWRRDTAGSVGETPAAPRTSIRWPRSSAGRTNHRSLPAPPSCAPPRPAAPRTCWASSMHMQASPMGAAASLLYSTRQPSCAWGGCG